MTDLQVREQEHFSMQGLVDLLGQTIPPSAVAMITRW